MEKGWRKIGFDPGLGKWAEAALPMAKASVSASVESWRSGDTWFVGVDALGNDEVGAVNGVPLPWAVLPVPRMPLHRAQLSTIRPGYPQPSDEETEASFRFRKQRDAAHLDGLLPVGPEKRRMVKEPHAFILGVPLNECSADASPLVVWEGSHHIMRAALAKVFFAANHQDWSQVDITEAYQAARRKVFETCPRVEMPVRPGEATLLHRLAIHGVAPWAPTAKAPSEGRIIAYFRPMLPSVVQWLSDP